jgi:hypothetical protein
VPRDDNAIEYSEEKAAAMRKGQGCGTRIKEATSPTDPPSALNLPGSTHRGLGSPVLDVGGPVYSPVRAEHGAPTPTVPPRGNGVGDARTTKEILTDPPRSPD